MDQLTTFRQSLAETIAWCTARATITNTERCLRTPTLDPGQLNAKLEVSERQACVARLIQARSRLLQDANVSPLLPATNLAGGRLLLFDPDGTLSDGAAAAYSRRFYDNDNVPPWDCWVLYVADPITPDHVAAEQAQGRRTGHWSHVAPIQGVAGPLWGPPYYVVDPLQPPRASYLVSWVPPALIPLAHTGLMVNPESCIEWLADRDTPFRRTLREIHLLV